MRPIMRRDTHQEVLCVLEACAIILQLDNHRSTVSEQSVLHDKLSEAVCALQTTWECEAGAAERAPLKKGYSRWVGNIARAVGNGYRHKEEYYKKADQSLSEVISSMQCCLLVMDRSGSSEALSVARNQVASVARDLRDLWGRVGSGSSCDAPLRGGPSRWDNQMF